MKMKCKNCNHSSRKRYVTEKGIVRYTTLCHFYGIAERVSMNHFCDQYSEKPEEEKEIVKDEIREENEFNGDYGKLSDDYKIAYQIFDSFYTSSKLSQDKNGNYKNKTAHEIRVDFKNWYNNFLESKEAEIKELKRQNKGFQDQYHVSGKIVNGLRDEVKELEDKLDKAVNLFKQLNGIHPADFQSNISKWQDIFKFIKEIEGE